MIKNVTVIGGNGIMGCRMVGLFAALGEARVYVVCKSVEKATEAIIKAASSVKNNETIKNMIPADYSMLEECLPVSELIYESVTENLETKKNINNLIGLYAKPGTIITTGTSGLSINELAKSLPDNLKPYYMGLHFCNPPYFLPLCELIASAWTKQSVIEETELYMKTKLHRQVIHVKDEAGFLGNRIGMYTLNNALNLAEKYANKGGIDYVDALLGGHTGRLMPPLVTIDFIGLDVYEAIITNLHENTDDYANNAFVLPEFAKNIYSKGFFGKKINKGLYMKVEKDGKVIHNVYDIVSNNYRPTASYNIPFVNKMANAINNGLYTEAFNILLSDDSEQAIFCKKFLIEYSTYAYYCADAVAKDLHDADIAMTTGFNWCPPSSIVRLFGKENFKALCNELLDKRILTNIDIYAMSSAYENQNAEYEKYFKV